MSGRSGVRRSTPTSETGLSRHEQLAHACNKKRAGRLPTVTVARIFGYDVFRDDTLGNVSFTGTHGGERLLNGRRIVWV